MTYFIYHIKGKKIGCTNNIHNRVRLRQQSTDFEVLEQYEDIYVASNREIELQKQYGYKVDTIPYWKTIKNTTSPQSRQKAVQNTDWEARNANTDYEARNKKVDWDEVVSKRKPQQYSTEQRKQTASKVDWIEANKKRVKKVFKPIFQYDDETLIKKWISQKEAGKALGISDSGINQCLKGKQKTAGGYKWRYE